MSHALLIETATERGGFALFADDALIYEKQLPPGYQNTQFLMPLLVETLTQHKLSVKNLSWIACGIGPGSYTGIRVAASITKTLAYACQLPLIGLCSLEAFIPKEDGSFVTLIDARVGGVYLLRGERSGDKIRYFSEPMICDFDRLENVLTEEQRIVTPHTASLQGKLEKAFPNRMWIYEDASPSFEHLGQRALEKFQRGEVNTPEDLDLLYLRKTQAEIERASYLP